jgi:hypothetical protein
MTIKKATKSRRVSISKRKLAETADEMEGAAIVAAITGEQEVIHGADQLKEASEMDAIGTAFIAKGASDLTRAEDEKVVSQRMAVLSDVVATAGVVDVTEGAEMLAASEDVGVMSALVGMMSRDDIEHGLELARLSGELHTASDILGAMKMPVMAAFLTERAVRLHEMSIEQIRIAISTDGVSQILSGAEKRINTLGENEVEEGLVRMAVSEAVSAESAARSYASEDLAVQGIEEMVIGSQVSEAAREEAVQGAAEISSGSAVIGAAIAMDDMAAALKEKSEQGQSAVAKKPAKKK